MIAGGRMNAGISVVTHRPTVIKDSGQSPALVDMEPSAGRLNSQTFSHISLNTMKNRRILDSYMKMNNE